MELLAELGPNEDPEVWAARIFDRERTAGRRVPGVGHRWHKTDRRAERLLDLAATVGGVVRWRRSERWPAWSAVTPVGMRR